MGLFGPLAAFVAAESVVEPKESKRWVAALQGSFTEDGVFVNNVFYNLFVSESGNRTCEYAGHKAEKHMLYMMLIVPWLRGAAPDHLIHNAFSIDVEYFADDIRRIEDGVKKVGRYVGVNTTCNETKENGDST